MTTTPRSLAQRQADLAAEAAARAAGAQVTACSVCGDLVADALHWRHEDRHQADDQPAGPSLLGVPAPDDDTPED